MKSFLRWATVVTTGTVLVLTSGTVAAAGPRLDQATVESAGNKGVVAKTVDDRPVTDAATAAEVAAFWTPERMAAAIDMDLVVDKPESTAPARARPAPTKPAGSVAPAAPTFRLQRLSPTAPTDVSPLQVSASQTVGKVFFVTPNGQSGTCSAASVNSPKGRLVMTAGHCVVNQNFGGWFENWVFVPRYRNGSRPFGTWTARQLTAPTSWVDYRDPDQDMAIAIMNNNAGRTIVSVVGGNGLRWNWGYDVTVTIIGYPAKPPFDGERQYYCLSPTWNGHWMQVRAWCTMTAGSSGAPWLQEYNNATGLGYINSVVSHRHDDPGQLDGPYFDDTIKALYDFAESLTP